MNALVAAQLADIKELQDKVEKMKDDLNEASRKVELGNEMLVVVRNKSDENGVECRKIRFFVCIMLLLLVARLMYSS